MACYMCNHCGNLKDGDNNVCSEDPRPGQGLELVCEDCIIEIEEEMEAKPASGAFTAEQQAFINKMEAEGDDYEDE